MTIYGIRISDPDRVPLYVAQSLYPSPGMGWNPSMHWQILTLTAAAEAEVVFSLHTVLARYAQSPSEAQADPGSSDCSEQLYVGRKGYP